MPRNTTGLKKGGPGRPAGVPNKATRAMKEVSREILEQPEAIDVLKRQARAGRLNPSIHITLMHYAYGKPKETVVHEGLAAMKGLTDEQLRDRASALLERLGARTATKALEDV